MSFKVTKQGVHYFGKQGTANLKNSLLSQAKKGVEINHTPLELH